MDLKILETIPVYPIMGEPLDTTNTTLLDFTEANQELANVDLKITELFQEFVDGHMSGKKYGIGGYMENRQIYKRSEVFASGEKYRNIHLGIDIWTAAGSPVYAPLSGVVHSFQNNSGFGNYGPTIILQHRIQGKTLYSLYGHLKLSDLDIIYEGRKFAKGELLCHLGDQEENGNWPPHLHFQLIRDMHDAKGDFPGVCSAEDLDIYKDLCPDPNHLIRFEGLHR
jgi:peptidoglycan LD-endopeptidase LytH